ncbi:MAG TPA: carboxypeptidase-like regulatory domain-containing protein [Pyrinomonadaceae bacterium]
MPRPNTPTRRLALALAAALLCAFALHSAAFAQKEAAATISGRVTDGERGAQGVTVTLFSNEPSQRFRVAGRARTDADGRFTMANVAPGRYQILPVAPAYVVEGLGTNYPPGRPLTIVAGEEVRDVDFKIAPGGVITGRVVDADGNPVIAEQVSAQPVEENPGPPRFNADQRDMTTDDRGVYRLFGLPPGRYRVSVGRAADSGAVSFGRRKLYRRTFYPDATEQKDARLVEVKSGIEATDVDISVGRALKTYRVAGRFVTADTNQPVPNVTVGFATVDPRGRRMGGYGGSATTNGRGEFITEGLAPGHYSVFASTAFPLQEATEFYSDPLFFEVTDGDVSGLVVKLKRGATVSGVVTIEGVTDRAAAAQMLAAVRVYPWIEVDRRQLGASMPPMRPVNVNPDGTFRLTGLSPGKLRIGTMNEAVRALSTARVELNGANVLTGFELTEGAQITGVHVVMVYGSATIVGQTTYANGTLPPGARVMAVARPAGQPQGTGVGTGSRSAEVDGRGFFRIEGVPAGEYEVVVHVIAFGGRPRRSAPQRVVVGDGGEAKVSPVVDLQ